MRLIAGLLLCLALLGCIPASRDRPKRAPAARVEDPRVLRQCLADLGRSGAKYQMLPNRVFAGGCSATGAVKLIEIGLPVANLGAMKCRLAERFVAWTNEALQTAALAWLDSRISKIETFGTFACRPVNGQAGNRLSEHGRANAVDISAFQFENGRRVTVREGWRDGDENVRNFLRAVHKAACRRFGVVLGPDANSLHHDHFHFDMSGGRTCR